MVAMTDASTADPLAALAAGTPVVDADLTAADLRTALRAADGPRLFRRCALDGLDLHGLDLSGTTFERCTVTEASLLGCVLDTVRVDGGSFAGCNFAEADLSDAQFRDVDLSRARFTSALLADTRFEGCRMIGANLSGLRDLAPSFVLEGSNLQLANLREAHLRGLALTGVDLTEADLRGADLRDAVFQNCRLRDTDLSRTRLAGADLRGADLGELTPDTPGQLRGAVISPAQAADACRALGLVVIG